ncbi:MAG: solute:Na+ symporter, family [Desulfuromonadales bacterium]|jgi:SSS family solute:Na+ symporter|nr:solute:Na+ symporter, family [Desulfuromonadales bacterium]
MTALHPADQIIILVYLAFVLGLGLWAGRRVKDLEDYAVAGRGYSALVIAMTLSASFIGGGFTMGNAEKVFSIGIINILVLWGFSLKEILVAGFIGPRMGQFPNAISVGDVMEVNYGKVGKVITGIFSVLLCAGILGAQVGGMGYLFNLFLGLPVPMGILLGMSIVILYDTLGGMRSVVATDVLQFCVLSLGIPFALFLGIRQVGGIEALAARVPADHFNLTAHLSPVQILSLFLTFLLGETLVPPYVRRLFISRHTRAVCRGTLWSGLFSIPFFAIAGGIGLLAMGLNPELNPNLALPYVIETILPIGLRGLVVAGIIAVVMSSADSFLNSASVAFVNDIINPLRRQPLTPKRGLLFARFATLITGSISVVFAIRIQSLIDILIYAYNFWSPIILVPLAATLLGVRAGTTAFCAGATAGLGGVFIWNRLLGTPGGFDGLVVGVFANLLVFCFVTRLLRQPEAVPEGVA